MLGFLPELSVCMGGDRLVCWETSVGGIRVGGAVANHVWAVTSSWLFTQIIMAPSSNMLTCLHNILPTSLPHPFAYSWALQSLDAPTNLPLSVWKYHLNVSFFMVILMQGQEKNTKSKVSNQKTAYSGYVYPNRKKKNPWTKCIHWSNKNACSFPHKRFLLWGDRSKARTIKTNEKTK